VSLSHPTIPPLLLHYHCHCPVYRAPGLGLPVPPQPYPIQVPSPLPALISLLDVATLWTPPIQVRPHQHLLAVVPIERRPLPPPSPLRLNHPSHPNGKVDDVLLRDSVRVTLPLPDVPKLNAGSSACCSSYESLFQAAGKRVSRPMARSTTLTTRHGLHSGRVQQLLLSQQRIMMTQHRYWRWTWRITSEGHCLSPT
jgi:hypothetical protein